MIIVIMIMRTIMMIIMVIMIVIIVIIMMIITRIEVILYYIISAILWAVGFWDLLVTLGPCLPKTLARCAPCVAGQQFTKLLPRICYDNQIILVNQAFQLHYISLLEIQMVRSSSKNLNAKGIQSTSSSILPLKRL